MADEGGQASGNGGQAQSGGEPKAGQKLVLVVKMAKTVLFAPLRVLPHFAHGFGDVGNANARR
eukprot:13342129-Alexandrium_andersonii.AAC.1